MAASRYAGSLKGSPAEEYLTVRGLAQETTRFGLGFVGNPLPGHEMFAGYLSIPYLRPKLDPKQSALSVVSLRFRCIRPECFPGTPDENHRGHGKYMTQAGDRPRMYNTTDLLVPGRTVCVTEGELDAITAHLCGMPTVGIPGAESWQKHFREPLLGYDCVYVLADGDEPGMRAATSVAGQLPNAKVIPMPPGEDVNSLVLREGKQALLDRIK